MRPEIDTSPLKPIRGFVLGLTTIFCVLILAITYRVFGRAHFSPEAFDLPLMVAPMILLVVLVGIGVLLRRLAYIRTDTEGQVTYSYRGRSAFVPTVMRAIEAMVIVLVSVVSAYAFLFAPISGRLFG